MTATNDLLKRIAFAVLGVSLIAYGLWIQSGEPTVATGARSATNKTSATATTAHPSLVKIPIKDMRVGTRVPAFNPEVSAAERRGFTEPNWYRWMKLKLEMPKPDGTMLEIEMLRSEDWLIQQMAVVVQPESIMLPTYSEAERTAANASAVSEPSSLGSPAIAAANNAATMEATVTETTFTESRSSEARSSEATPSDGFDVPLRPIYFHLASLLGEVAAGGDEVLGLVVQLDLPELGLSGPAWIVDLEPAPITAPGPGQVVTATFKHASADVLDLVLTNTTPTNLSPSPSALSSSPTDSIGVTANHPFWSVDRAEFVQAGELQIGERLQTLAGDIHWVQQKLPRPGPEPVYNLEVHAEHVYYVGSSGVLAHNFYPKGSIHKAISEGDGIARGLYDHASNLLERGVRTGPNLAVVAIRLPNGKTIFKGMFNTSKDLHSEVRLLASKMKKYTDRGAEIVGIFSEKRFCGTRRIFDQDCFGKLQDFSKSIGQLFPGYWKRN